MAASTHKFHPHKKPTTNIKFRRRKIKETTFSGTAAAVVSPENSSWCCPSYINPPKPTSYSLAFSPEAGQNTRSLFSGTPENQENTTMATTNHPETFPSSFTNFNSALTAGLLNPMSPPPPSPVAVSGDKTRSSPTLFEMMANEPNGVVSYPTHKKPTNHPIPPPIVIDKQALIQQRLSDLLSIRSPGSQFNDPNSSDVKLSLISKDGLSVSMNVHRQILVGHSRFFAVKLSDYRSKSGQMNGGNKPCIVEIADCDDIEVYVESIRLMYCKNLKRKLTKEDVPRILGILKVSAAIGFDAGVLSCLEYLEAAPWAEDEEEKVSALLSELHLEGAVDVLKRVSIDSPCGAHNNHENEEIVLKLIHTVLDGKDEKARREMKVVVAKMLHKNPSPDVLRTESLHSASDKCLRLLRIAFLNAANGDLRDAGQIARQADNLHWIIDILIDRQIAEAFLRSWGSEKELSGAHSKVPAIHRYEISRVTARLFVGIGKGQFLASRESRCLLLETWLVPFYDDFAWMKRASRGLDRHLIEDGLSNTILTLPMSWQREIFMAWFDRFLNCSEDCPNIQRGFEVWWRRAFWRRKNGEQPESGREFRIINGNFKNS